MDIFKDLFGNDIKTSFDAYGYLKFMEEMEQNQKIEQLNKQKQLKEKSLIKDLTKNNRKY